MSRYVLTLELEQKQAAFSPPVKTVALEKGATYPTLLLAGVSVQASWEPHYF
jgi:hypothetical protein